MYDTFFAFGFFDIIFSFVTKKRNLQFSPNSSSKSSSSANSSSLILTSSFCKNLNMLFIAASAGNHGIIYLVSREQIKNC